MHTVFLKNMAQAQLDYVQKVKIEENQSIKVENDLQNLINSLEIPQPISGNMSQLDQNIFQDNNDSPKKRLIRNIVQQKLRRVTC